MSGGFYKTVTLNEEHFQKIEDVLKAKLSDENKLALQRACDSYLIDREAPVSRPSRAKKQLQVIQKYCGFLIDALEKADDLTVQELTTHHPSTIMRISERPGLEQEEREALRVINAGYFKQIGNLLETLPNNLQIIQNAAEKALRDLESDKGGSTKYVALDSLILKLASIYKDVTGKKTASRTWNEYEGRSEGPFLEFCKLFLSIICEEHSNESLSSRIKRAPQKVKTLL